jgi:hypothetical protein
VAEESSEGVSPRASEAEKGFQGLERLENAERVAKP